MAMNTDMDKYLRDRKRAKAVGFANQRPWWSKMFDKPKDDFPEDEQIQLETMERQIKTGDEKLKAAVEHEEELEEVQEERVSLYTKFRRLFQKERKLEDAYEHVQMMEQAPDVAVTDDFRALAQIQMRWLARLPTRVKEEFKESEDFKTYTEILKRRGVAKTKSE
jgi:predicted oxidoreductase